MAREQTDVLQGLVNRLRETRKEAGDRLGEMLADRSVRERAAAVADKIEDLRLELTRRLRRGQPATKAAAEPETTARAKPLSDMSVRELHQLAAKRHITGRSSMKRAELIDALQKDLTRRAR